MYVALAPFAISVIAAIFADNSEQGQGEDFGALGPVASPSPTLYRAQPRAPITTSKAATRFGPLSKGFTTTRKTAQVPGSAGTTAPTTDSTQGPTQESEPGSTPPTEATPDEEPVDPLEVVHQAIESELMMDEIANEVIEDMGIGEWDEDIEEDLATEEAEDILERRSSSSSETQDEMGATETFQNEKEAEQDLLRRLRKIGPIDTTDNAILIEQYKLLTALWCKAVEDAEPEMGLYYRYIEQIRSRIKQAQASNYSGRMFHKHPGWVRGTPHPARRHPAWRR